ncbi:hypothetical protein LCGC14_0761830 [marine sediment metagenome]|uniref:Phosphoadenosine phosphosulphate reductase domain-containing protein n=1 Tax=marine sediment metagenome TaxID=412755 RepID=A0A0F9T7X9_9ZZZZ|nr:hypothetical protein [bacterium]
MTTPLYRTFEALPDPVFRALSWGCGRQSTVLAVMSALGELEPLDLIIMADTMWERRRTYEVQQFYIKWLRDRGQRVEVVSVGSIRKLGAEEHIHIPFWTDTGGPLHRQCTRHFKIDPIKRRIRQIMGYPTSVPPHPPMNSVELWLGITWDETERMKDSLLQFMVHRWPLLEHRLTRLDCTRYLEALYLPVPIKSSCVICPYRLPSEWIHMRDNDPPEWHDSINFDRKNRNNPLADRGASTADSLYIYKYNATPLEDAPLEADAKRERKGKQLPLMCGGYCHS